MDFAGPTTAGMLTAIDNGLGKVTQLAYRSSASLAIAAEAAGQPWTQKLPLAVPIPVALVIDPGAGGPLRVSHYGVRDGFWDGVEQRLGGFLHTRQETEGSTPAESLIEDTDFLPGLGSDRVLRGRARLVRRQSGAGELFETIKTDWEALAVGGGRPITRQVETFAAQGVTAAIPTRTSFEFDADGRPIVERRQGRLDLSGDEAVVKRSFADDATAWVRDRVFEETVLEADEVTVASSTRTFYGGPTGAALALGQIGIGLVRRVDGLLAASARWVTQRQVGYDSCGNATDVFEGGVSRTVSFVPNCLRPTSETVFPNGSGQPGLTWSMTWNVSLDQPSTLTNPDGDLTTITYDSLSRPTDVAINGAIYTRFRYDWTLPRPRTTTWVFDGTFAELGTPAQTWPTGTKWRSSVAVTNGAGEALFSSTPLGDGTSIVSGWKERDERGLVTLMAESFVSTSALPSTLPTAAPQPRVQTFDHDALGRLSRSTLPNGSARVVTYAAFSEQVAAAEFASVLSTLDGQGRVAHTERTVDGLLESADARYDAAGRLLRMTLQPASTSPVVHGFGYDTLGRLVAADDPDGGHRDLVYDDGNFLRQHTNGVNQTVFFDYDGAGRLTRRGETATPAAATDVVYTYDNAAVAEASGCHVRSRLARATEPAGEARLCYDVLGRDSGVLRTISPPGAAVKTASEDRSLSPSGLVLGMNFDDGLALIYRYDRAGRPFAISDGTKDLWRADTLDGAGRVQHETYANAATGTFQYDTLGLPSRVTVKGAAAASLYDVIVDRNSYGAPRTIADQETAGLDHTATFGYDGAARLVSATLGKAASQYQFAFRYDGLQNMTLRRVIGPAAIHVLDGVYRYGEPKAGTTTRQGPRQLTSVVPEATP